MHAATAEVLGIVRGALLDAWALVQPVDCLGCGAPDRAICADCRRELGAVNARRIRCDADLTVPVWTAADYAGRIRSAILALKEHGRADAARVLAPILLAAVRAAAEDAHARTPGRLELARIPTTRRALVRRGLDPLAEVLRTARLPVSPVLRPTRQWLAGSQKTRDRAGRLAGARGRFRGSRDLRGRTFLLVDDVATTGATLAAAVLAIEAAGGRVVACAALAAPDLGRRSAFPKDSVTDS